jgi:hypothetical protein
MGDNVEFNCPSCGRYRISGTAFEVIRSFPEATRNAALERAKKRSAVDGSIPKILYDDFSSI